MGMYTEIYVNIDLKDDTPQDVLKVLEMTVEGGHTFVGTEYPNRWALMFHGSSYLPNTSCAILKECPYMGRSLLGKGSIKNYGSEIEKFFEFIAPYSNTEFLGYMRYEEDEVPTLMYKSEILGE